MAQTVSQRNWPGGEYVIAPGSVAAQTCLADQLLDTFWNVGL